MASLGVNIDHIANIREARRTVEPDPVSMALLAELGGADGITVHLREDRRHIQDRDVELLRQTVRSRLNLEMASTEEMVAIALRIKPDMVTLVPERREEVTTEGGLDVAGQKASLSAMVQTLQAAGIPVSLFVDPEATQLQACKNTGACWVELHTGRYADADWSTQPQELARLQEGTAIAQQLGLRVNAGHGLTYQNVEPIAAIAGMEELNIGHTIVARSVAVGLQQAVRDMKVLVQNPRLDPLFGQAPG
ncbi:pyridoxine 5'-phosphate synthase [Synechococcus sp. CC9605]|uniref:Pyridoxine 5'-phosphate synthase n=1 Tax=Synechococcus sp. (strain CC9605) TaxID=110662 RepID=PDXJ_SYNSC|nr:pyridoxine 5'-phosphate synthase [Synechococcus sp. CC9605]Q3AJ26.1 RecName: Full=Pyridoxine 5'-phosphate synthase; Short=PNP synthase [Synechococcus sp. CC9605]ABB35406.1 pyridoxal phosphate biosynthetic protein PdxJ [Synechococcus sp. CC9605]